MFSFPWKPTGLKATLIPRTACLTWESFVQQVRVSYMYRKRMRHRMGNLMFSQVCVCPQGRGTPWSLVTGPCPGLWSQVLSGGGGVPQSCHWSCPKFCPSSWPGGSYPLFWPGGASFPGRAVTQPRTGTPPDRTGDKPLDRTGCTPRKGRRYSLLHRTRTVSAARAVCLLHSCGRTFLL